MIYERLADIYDALVKDDEATKIWCDYTKLHVKGNKILEVACGSGEVAISLAKQGYQVTATDLSPAMLTKAQNKPHPDNLVFKPMDMTDFTVIDHYNGIICYCDSINYLTGEQQWKAFFQAAYDHLLPGGVLLFDMHHETRLQEFQEPFIEDGQVGDTYYQWTITNHDNAVLQYFNITSHGQTIQEQHIQRVYPLSVVVQWLENLGFQVKVDDDLTMFGEDLQERYFIRALKG